MNSEFSGWAVTNGYEEFIKEADQELKASAAEVLANISPDSIRGSLQHPNGFLVNTLKNNAEGQLRLHFWPTGRFDDLTPHSHPRHMASLILAGTYTEFIPDVKLNDASEHKLMGTVFNEERQQIGNGYTGRNVRFSLGKLATYTAGESHYLPAGEFHITPLPETAAIITLIRTSQQLFETPTYVLRQRNQEAQLSNAPDRKPPTEDEVQTIWSQLVPIIEEAHSAS
jgi:hypothetical protein